MWWAMLTVAACMTADDPGDGRFGGALDAKAGPAVAAAARDEYRNPPLTLECWARLDGREGFNVLVAHAAKETPDHWELYTAAGSGRLQAFVPGSSPQVVDSGVDVVDGRWHHLMMIYEPRRLRLAVDGRIAADTAIEPGVGAPVGGPLWFGAYPPQRIGCDGRIDAVRLSRGAREIAAPGDQPPAADAPTIGLWPFDEAGPPYADTSTLANPATREAAESPLPRPAAGPPAYEYDATDEEDRIVLVDREPRESLLTAIADAAGRLFVGGREALFVYEPDPAAESGYGRRHELFRFPPDSWVNGLAVRGDDLYAMTNSALYRLPGARRKRAGLTAERIVWGLPVDLHVTLHAIAFGPEGDLYFVSGDPLLNFGDFDRRPDHWGHWTVFGGPPGAQESHPYTGQGGVFRVRPDGKGWTPVAGGLRGAFGLAFDRRWELFTADNDHESRPADYVPARILHATPGADFGWPRGWLASKSSGRADLLDSLTDALGREVPVGMIYADEPGRPTDRDALILARWGQRRLDRLPLRTRGATFAADPSAVIAGRGAARPVGVAVGPGGSLAAIVSALAANEWSPAYQADLILIKRDDQTIESLVADAYEPPDAPADRLWVELAAPSWSRRLTAHQEILRRGGPLLDEAAARIARDPEPPGPLGAHLPWLAAASGRAEVRPALERVARESTDPGRRVQSLRALAAFPALGATRDLFVAALDDPDPLVVRWAIAALADRPGPIPPALVTGPARSADPALRQSAVHLLADQAPAALLDELTRADDPAARLAGVLAIGRRLSVPSATGALPEGLALRYESKNAEFTIRYADATIDLRTLGPIGSFIAIDWRAARGPSTAADPLFDRLTALLDDPVPLVRQQSAFFLNLIDPSIPIPQSAIRNPQSEIPPARLVGAAAGGDPSAIAEEFVRVDWTKAAGEGDPVRGGALFAADQLGCARCHAVSDDRPVSGGPSLAGAAKRLTVEHLVESILAPGRKVADGFRPTALGLADGRVLTGLVVRESDAEVELLLPDTTRRLVPKAEVEERSEGAAGLSPMPAGLVRTPDELRDLLAYLLADPPGR